MNQLNLESRLVLHPIKYKDLYDKYTQLKNIWWMPNEIKFKKDKDSYQQLPENIQNQLKYVLAFFAFGDELVMKNINFNFSDIDNIEVNLFYNLQTGNEAIHNEVYNNAINEICYGNDIIKLIENDEVLVGIQEYIKMIIFEYNNDIRLLVLIFIMLEGLLFSGSFAWIYWLDKKYPNQFPGLKLSNDFIARDENIHTMFGINLLEYSKEKPSQESVHMMFEYFIDEIITKFVKNIIGSYEDELMNNDNLLKYYHFQADYLLSLMDYDKIYNVENPFIFMKELALERRANNFQSQNYNYIMDPKIDLSFMENIMNNIKIKVK